MSYMDITDPGLQFYLPISVRALDKVTQLRVVLDPSDTYSVISYRKLRGQLDYVEVARQSGIYCYMLESTFTEMTGLYTSL